MESWIVWGRKGTLPLTPVRTVTKFYPTTFTTIDGADWWGTQLTNPRTCSVKQGTIPITIHWISTVIRTHRVTGYALCNRPINTGVSRFEFYGFYFRNHLAHFHKYTIYIRGFLIIRFPGFDTPGPLHCHPYLLLTYGQMGTCNPLHLRDSKVFWTALSQSSAQYRGQRCVKLTRTALGQTVNCSQQPWVMQDARMEPFRRFRTARTIGTDGGKGWGSGGGWAPE